MGRTVAVLILIGFLMMHVPVSGGEWNDITRLTYSGSANHHTIMTDHGAPENFSPDGYPESGQDEYTRHDEDAHQWDLEGEDPAHDPDGSVHIVFQETAGSRSILRYMKIDGSGQTIVPPRTIISGPGDSICPEGVLHGQGTHLVWWDSRSGSYRLYHTLIDRYGTRIREERVIDTGLQGDIGPLDPPRVALDRSGNLFITWSQHHRVMDGPTGSESQNPSVYMLKIDPAGEVIIPTMRISSPYFNAINPDIVVDGSGRVHMVWSEDSTGNFEIYLATFVDRGTSIHREGKNIRLTDTRRESVFPALLSHENALYMSWSDGGVQGLVYSLHLSRIHRSGILEDLTVADRGNALHSRLTTEGDRIHIVWQDDRHSLAGGQRDVLDQITDNLTEAGSHLRRYIPGEIPLDPADDPANWEIYHASIDPHTMRPVSQTRITHHGSASVTPEILTNARGEVQIVWTDSSRSSGDLFHIGSSVPDIDTDRGIGEVRERSILVMVGIAIMAMLYLISGKARQYGIHRLLVLPLYSTISRDRLLENANRKQIFQLITTNQGITFTDLKEELGIMNGALAYHLQTLERRQYIKSVRDGKYRRFYPRGAQVSHLSSIEEKILDAVRTKPSISQQEIAGMIDSTPQSVNYNIRKLKDRGILSQIREGRHARYSLINGDP